MIVRIRDKRDYILFPFQIQNKLCEDKFLHMQIKEVKQTQ